MVQPAFGILYSKGINGFSDLDPHQRRHDGNRNALYFFIVAILSTCTVGIQNYMFASAAAALTAKVQSLSFRAIVRQDSEFRPFFNFVSVCLIFGIPHSRIL
jgi:ATP-binding cassette subfamily B (MDR/TAP) protein 1